jgi:CBS domain-containing protein
MTTRTLEMISLTTELAAPLTGNWSVKLEDPARSVMTDFTEQSLISVNSSLQVDQALEHMKHAQTRSAFVTDAAKKSIVGLITAYEIMGERPIRFVQLNGGAREEVLVADIMDRSSDWQVARLSDVDRVNVAMLLATFQKTGRTHIAVIEEDEGKPPRLRGVFSAAKILRLTTEARKKAKAP